MFSNIKFCPFILVYIFMNLFDENCEDKFKKNMKYKNVTYFDENLQVHF